MAALVLQMRTLRLREESHLSTYLSNHVPGPGGLSQLRGVVGMSLTSVDWLLVVLIQLLYYNLGTMRDNGQRTVIFTILFAPLIRPISIQSNHISSILKSGGIEN